MTVPTPQPLHPGDRAWFSASVDALLPELYGRALRLCRDRDDAEDLVAGAVARAWEKLPALADRDAFRSWLFTIMNNSFVSHCRTARAQAEHETLEDAAEFSLFEQLHAPILLWWSNPELDFLNSLLRQDLTQAIDGLDDVFREVVVLVDVQGLSYAEVAALLDIPVGTVRSRLARGRSRLQQALWQHGVEAGLTAGSQTQRSRDGAA